MQAHKPVREQEQVVGHAVRAMYMYVGMADLELLGAHGGTSYLPALERLWTHLTAKRMYVTGGIGPSAGNEGFTSDYDLPDESAYAETCAGIGLMYWAQRMLHLTGDGKYTDVLERALYNNVLAGVSQDGTLFNYVNPLASRGAHHRKSFFSCACCPPNVVRLLASVGNYFYSTSDDGLWVHLYAQTTTQVASLGLTLEQRTLYPKNGKVELRMRLKAARTFTVRLRIPDWCENSFVRINNGAIGADDAVFEKGYLHIAREWRNGDVVTLDLDMAPQLISANPQVPQTLGRAAIQRGPLVYCIEQVDNGPALDALLIGSAVDWRETNVRGRALPVLVAPGLRAKADWGATLYRNGAADYDPVTVTAVPYCDWDNRAQGEMRVWLRCI